MPRTPPPIDDLDDELLAALGESRLTRAEEERVIERLRADDGERAAFRDLYPERFDALFGHNVIALAGPAAGAATLPPAEPSLPGARPGLGAMPPTPPAWRLLAFGLVASVAIVLVLALPPAAPVQTHAVYHPLRGGGAVGPTGELVRGEHDRPAIPLMVDLGEPSRWDRLRGRTPWGAIVVAPPGGRPMVLATSARPGDCTATETTLACLSRTPYAGVAVVVSSGPADAPLDALVTGSETWPAFQAALTASAAHEPWAVHFPLENTAD